MKTGGTLLLLALLWGGAPDSAVRAPRPQDSATLLVAPGDTLLDSARAEFEAGRFWHASRLLRSSGAASGVPTADVVLLLARADAGWKNWDGVIEGLEGADWLDALQGGEGRRLLARAMEARERWDAAAESYARFRGLQGSSASGGADASREARSAARAGRWESVLEALEIVGQGSTELVGWTALDVSEWAATNGTPEQAVELLPWIKRDSLAADAGWDIEARALLAVGDTGGALEAYLATLEVETLASRRGTAFSAIGGLRIAAGDSAGAREAFLASLAVHARGASGAQAASSLLEMDDLGADLALRAAQTLDRARENHAALAAYRRYQDLRPDSAHADPSVDLTIARLLSATGQHDDAVARFRVLVETDDPKLELAVLDQWLRTRRRQGRRDAVRTIQGWIIERFPESQQAVDIMFSWADAAQDRGDQVAAISGFERAMTMAPTFSSAGHARMRLGQIHLLRNDAESAARIFQAYLDEFPKGRRWEEASYWTAHSLQALDRASEAEQYFERIRLDSPISYYAALVAERRAEPFSPPVPQGPVSDPAPWLKDGLRTLDLFGSAGLDEAVSSQVRFLLKRAEESESASLDLADALIERGFTIDGINVGWRLLREGSPYTLRLLKVLYPFPYREVVTREAEEAGIEPMFLASLIRQESAFAPSIKSPAGAIGLMQVMPATGEELARGLGIRGFTSESLETAEINLHLGTTFWVEMERRYGEGNLPLALSAYNAGPTRARRWRRMPEAEDPLRFTERIPFAETRGYVKNITRNMHVYRFLYGQD